MRPCAALVALGVTLGAALPAAAQDFVGFDRASFGQVVLKRNQSAGSTDDLQLELAIGSYNNESIRNYSQDSVFATLGLAVGRLDILTDTGIFPCTAFIVSDRHILTNHHCVPGILENEKAGATRIDAVQFVAGYTQQGVEDGTRSYIVSPTPVEMSKDLDYAVLEVIGNPSAEYGTLALSDKSPQDGDPYWVIGHPMGEAQRISREQCRANSPALSDQRLLHTCDTLPGNSGSPIIDASLQKVVGLHHAGSRKDSVNFAIPMRDILAASGVLTAALSTTNDASPVAATGGQPVGADALCDALYEEAKAYGQCFAYDAYVQRCTAHPYVVFAQGFLDQECREQAAAPQPVEVPQPVQPAPAPVQESLLRPWCDATGLNPTERTICSNAYLAGLDQELGRVYGAQTARSTDAQQRAWLRGTRDACGADANCIARVVLDRITYLQTPAPAPAPAPSGLREAAGNYTLADTQCYIITASRPTVGEAQAFAASWFPGRSGVRIFRSDNGWYAISFETARKSDSEWRLSQLKSQNAIPGDSYCSSGRRFVAELVGWGSASSGGSTGGTSSAILYVDNNSDGGLNVRTGPGTNYRYFTEIDPGTELRLLRASGSWSNVLLPDGREGWVYTPLLTRTRPYVRQCSARVVNMKPISQLNRATGSGYLNVRSQPSTKGKILTEVYQGDSVRVLARKNGWARIECISGYCTNPYSGTAFARGWSSEKYLSISCR